MLGVGASKKTYLDDVFHIQVHAGNSATRSINNGINLSSSGGLIWAKTRDVANSNHTLFDTVRGATKYLSSSTTSAEATYTGNGITSFNNNGYTLGDDSSWQGLNHSGNKYVLNTFRKAPGFFTIKQYTGTGSAQSISHDLGSIPGCIMIKRLDSSTSWKVYHRGTGAEKALALDLTNSAVDSDNYWNDTEPTASVFTVKANTHLNASGATYVAYLFAGGESTAATARSVDFDGDDYLSLPVDSDLDLGNSDFTFEAWFKPDTNNSNQYIFNTNNNGLQVYWTANKVIVYGYDGSSWFINGEQSPDSAKRGLWNHVAVTRSNNVFRCFLNGSVFYEATHSNTFVSLTTNPTIGRYYQSALYFFYGKISNLRLVKGTAVYTSSFRPPTEPLTNITNTKLLCCNNSSTTGSTVTPGTITANGNPTASSDSPFDDPAGFVFGESGSENVIKCGSYVGNGSSTGPEINLGWEPQWVMVKRTDSTDNWAIYDVMRGITTGGTDNQLRADQSAVEHTTGNTIAVTPTGFKFETSGSEVNANSGEYLYMAIRRPDGYVGKPVETATSVFAMDTGSSSSTIPTYDSGFPVDFGLFRQPGTSESWYSCRRLTGATEMKLNNNDAEQSMSLGVFDSNTGWSTSKGSSYQSWMWKRHAGFDVVTYEGNGVAGRPIPHSLNKTAEMVWVKCRTSSNSTIDWWVYHKGLDSGNQPETHYLRLNYADAEGDSSNIWHDTAPTSTHFTVGSGSQLNNNGDTFIAMLFASVDGISKVGSYTGNGTTGQTITTGFQPRFLLIKNTSNANNWFILDTLRGWGSGNDNYLQLDKTDQQYAYNFGEPTSTGFSLTQGDIGSNQNGDNYIYYAHA